MLYLSLFLAIAFAADDKLAFTEAGDYPSRHVERGLITSPGYLGFWYETKELNETSKAPLAGGDTIRGTFYIPAGVPGYPVNWQVYYPPGVKVNATGDWVTYDVSGASSYIASVYESLVEKNSTGGDVATQSLSSVWAFDELESTLLTNVTAGIFATVFKTTFANGATVQLRYIVTEHSGKLNTFNDVFVIPKAVETIVVISDWTYADPKNTLSLVVVSGSGAVAGTSTGHLWSGNGASEVFFHVSPTDQIYDGTPNPPKTEEVHVGYDAVDSGKYFTNTPVQAQLTKKYGNAANAGVFSSQFSASAKVVVYGATLGSGPDPDAPTNVGLIVGLTVGLFVLLVAIIAFLYYYRKRLFKGYQKV